jgi:twitching motility protein PilT
MDITSGRPPGEDGLHVFDSTDSGEGGGAPAMHPLLEEYLVKGFMEGCTDVHLRAHEHPVFRGSGKLIRGMNLPKLSGAQLRAMALSILSPAHRARLERQGDCDLSLNIAGAARYRINVFLERGSFAIAARVIPEQIPGFEELGLPVNTCQRLSMLSRGLVLITGPTGSGKTTTLAAMVDYINGSHPSNIITIEDPIEYRHYNKLALISQREIGQDATSFHYALRSALRQDPDVLLVGELRDLETIRVALTAAETGHLVLATLHTNSAVSTVERIIDAFPSEHQPQVRLQLSMTLRGVICQALLPSSAGTIGGRVLACEVLLGTQAVANMIRDGKPHQLHSVIEMSQADGMRTFDSDLLRLIRAGKISIEQAISISHKPEEFRKEIGGVYAR